jgi:hypothetical protein
MRRIALVLGLLLGVCTREIPAFLPLPRLSFRTTGSQQQHQSALVLNSGFGIATNYTWQEEAFEIDVTVRVPKHIRAKDIAFKATAKSIDLRLKSSADKDDDSSSEIILLDGTRKLRGRVSTDGTYWVISDAQDNAEYREVTVTIEKIIKTPKDDFEVIDYDWKGIYSDDDDEVSERKYDEAEALDVREYAAGLGVDLDNLNMSMVDKTMFSSGLNLTQNSLDELTKTGYAQEVTRQADGTESITDEETGEQIPMAPLGIDSIDAEELKSAGSSKIPFLDTNSPWHKANTVPVVQVDRESNKTYVQQSRNFTRAAFAEDSAKEASDDDKKPNPKDAADPIDMLTVKRLKEILKSQGLPTSGVKKELQDRLRTQVNSLLQGNQGE